MLNLYGSFAALRVTINTAAEVPYILERRELVSTFYYICHCFHRSHDDYDILLKRPIETLFAPLSTCPGWCWLVSCGSFIAAPIFLVFVILLTQLQLRPIVSAHSTRDEEVCPPVSRRGNNNAYHRDPSPFSIII